MNRFIARLAARCREQLLTEKWIVAPSRRAGYQWLETVTRAGEPALNAHVQTVRGIALRLAAGELARREVVLLDDLGGPLLMDRLWEQLRARRRLYLFLLSPGGSLAEMAWRTLQALRLAGLSAGELKPGHFEVADKAEELASLMDAYAGFLDEHALIDFPEVLRLAERRVRADSDALGADVRVLLPTEVLDGLTLLERRLVEAMGDACEVLDVAERPDPAPQRLERDVELLAWLDADAGPDGAGDGSLAVARGVGEVGEVRAALRTCLAEGTPLDEVELLHTDRDAYVPLVYETAGRLWPECGELPVTFAEGLPAAWSRPGRALEAWSRWVAEDYAQPALVGLFREGLLRLPAGAPPHSQLAAELRTTPVGFGRDRYLPELDRAIEATRRRLARPEFDENGEPISSRAERRLASLETLRAVIAGLLEATPSGAAGAGTLLGAARSLLDERLRCANEFDEFARQAIDRRLGEALDWLERFGDRAGGDAWSWLGEQVEQIRVLGSSPRPGKLHVAPLVGGGHSGRPRTFVLGLDEQRDRSSGLEDPLLLDSERRRLSANLPSAGEQAARRRDELRRTLGRLRGAVTLSYASRDPLEGRDVFPGPTLLRAWRLLKARADASAEDLLRAIPPSSFAPTDPAAALDASDVWLALGSGPGGLGEQVADVFHPHLARGRTAARGRRGRQFTVFDGLLEEPGAELDPRNAEGPVLSASRLETLGACPRRYFFRYVLGIQPPEELRIEPTEWLDAMRFGLLMHEIFHDVLSELDAVGIPLNDPRAGERIAETADRLVERYRGEFPPPGEGVYRRDRRRLDAAARVFVVEEGRREPDVVRRFCEVSLGLEPVEPGTELDAPEPVEAPLPGGGSVRVRGRIDRVDELADGTLALWDYKSGRPGRYRRGLYRGGRIVQHCLYLAMIRQCCDVAPARLRFGYFFPAAGQGERLQWSPRELDAGSEVIERLCNLAGGGVFLPTDDAADCRFCDYKLICRPCEPLAERTGRALDGGEYPDRVDDYAELRREIK